MPSPMVKHIPIILLLFIPYILFLLFRQKINFHHPHKSKINIIDIITLIIFIILFIISINTNKTDVNSAYKLFYEIWCGDRSKDEKISFEV